MNKVLRGKLGTHATALYLVKDFEKVPKEGDLIEIISEMDERVLKWTRVRVCQVAYDTEGKNPFFFMEMF